MNVVRKLTLIAAATGVLLAQGTVSAYDGQVNFTGSVTETGCTVASGNNGKVEVQMGNVAKQSFTGIGTRTNDTLVPIVLTGCPTDKKVTAKLSGPTVANNTLIQITQGDGVATGIGIGVVADDGTTSVVMQNAPGISVAADGSATINLRAFYQQYQNAVTSGAANAVADITLTYI